MSGWHDERSEAQRLRLEEHLQGCAACRQRLSFDRGVRAWTQEERAPSLSESARRRVLSAALLASGERALPVGSERPGLAGWKWAAAGLSGGALVAAGVLVLALGSGSEDPETGAQPPSAQVVTRAAHVPPEQEAPEPVWQAIDATPRMWRGVQLAAQDREAEVRLDPDGSLHVRGGETVRVVAKGDAERRVQFVDYEARFVVAAFEARKSGVFVSGGEVLLQPAGGAAVRVASGEHWSAAPEASMREGARTHASHARGETARGAVKKSDPGAALARARQKLAAGDVSGAEALALEVIRGSERGPWRAEAQTLLAECSAGRGAWREALRRYREVARQYRGTLAGQNALFAAGQTAHRAGLGAQARTLWQTYLRDYPAGLFGDDVRSKLAR